jgi:hypothetical protein
VAEPDRLSVRVSGHAVPSRAFCVNPLHERYEFDFRLPPQQPSGPALVEVALGERGFAPVRIEVVNPS